MAGQDIGFFGDDGEVVDIVIENGDLKADDGLETAVLISLFSDRYQDPDELPAGDDDPRGWWADSELSEPTDDEIGSLIWISERGKNDSTTRNRIEDSIREALQWMVDDGIADSVAVTSERISQTQSNFSLEVRKPSGENVPFKFLWDAQELRRIAA